MAFRKEGVISGDQGAKWRRLKSLREDLGFKTANNNSKISTKWCAEWVLHARLGELFISVGSHASWWLAGSSQWMVSQTLHTTSTRSLHHFARAEYSWAIIFFLYCVCVLVTQSCLTLWDPMHCSSPGSSVHGDSLRKNTGVSCHSLLQGIFPMQGSNLGLPNYRQIVYHLSHQGSPIFKNLFIGCCASLLLHGGFL